MGDKSSEEYIYLWTKIHKQSFPGLNKLISLPYSANILSELDPYVLIQYNLRTDWEVHNVEVYFLNLGRVACYMVDKREMNKT